MHLLPRVYATYVIATLACEACLRCMITLGRSKSAKYSHGPSRRRVAGLNLGRIYIVVSTETSSL